MANSDAERKGDESEGPGRRWSINWSPREIARVLTQALTLVYRTSPGLFVAYGVFTLVLGVLPPAVAFCTQRLVDAVVWGASRFAGAQREVIELCLPWLLAEAGLVLLQDASSRVLRACQAVLRGSLGHRIHLQILGKACNLDLTNFEDPDFYDKLLRARRGASSRPLSLVDKSCLVIQQSITLVGVFALLWDFSPWAIALVVSSALPSFFAQTKFSGESFSFFSLKSEDTRRQYYFERALTLDDYAKEVKLFGLGSYFLSRYRRIFDEIFKRERNIILRREFWLFFWGRIRFVGFYAGYAWVTLATLSGRLSLGQMTMYWLLLRQGQGAVQAGLTSIGAMYEDHLYLSTLHEFLDQPSATDDGEHECGLTPGSGIEFREVVFCYPGASEPVLKGVSFKLVPGQSMALVGQNGAGKTTLIKLLTRLYRPNQGSILLDGRPLQAWKHRALLARIGVIFQDFNRYHLSAGQNIGVGDVQRVDDEDAWRKAAQLGMATSVVERLPEGFETQLGRWFRKGHELSGGQWQKIALSRAMMREGADLLVFDEPTAAMDAESEMLVFEHIRSVAQAQKMVLLISHRFSTVRTADMILVLEDGAIVERGDHGELMAARGRYARLYDMQAKGFAGGQSSR